jgi:hypothetical protein
MSEKVKVCVQKYSLLTKLLTAIKESRQRYCITVYSRSGVNQIWILKNSKELIENLKSHDYSKIDSIKTFSTLYTTILHNKLKSRLFQIIENYLLYWALVYTFSFGGPVPTSHRGIWTCELKMISSYAYEAIVRYILRYILRGILRLILGISWDLS